MSIRLISHVLDHHYSSVPAWRAGGVYAHAHVEETHAHAHAQRSVPMRHQVAGRRTSPLICILRMRGVAGRRRVQSS